MMAEVEAKMGRVLLLLNLALAVPVSGHHNVYSHISQEVQSSLMKTIASLDDAHTDRFVITFPNPFFPAKKCSYSNILR